MGLCRQRADGDACRCGPSRLPLFALVLTVLAMNARYILLSASLRPPFGTLPFWQIYPGLAIFGDGNWMLTMREVNEGAGRTRASCSAAAW